MPAPSPSTVPSASGPNERAAPVRDSAFSRQNTTMIGWVRETWTPPASAMSVFPLRSSSMASPMATSEPAQAASTAYAGPIRFRRLAMRPHMMLGINPGAVSAS
jgi:hypothetical protein